MRIERSVLRVALLGALLCAACAYAASAAHPPLPSEAEEAASAARAALARLPPEARLGEIKNERLRRAVQETYRAVVGLADNRESGKVSALNAKFERAYASVGRETARGEHKQCAANCKALDGEPCLMECRSDGKKFCGCKLIVFGCIVAECVF
jgi:membrane-bound lytic murein transglycosylase B